MWLEASLAQQGLSQGKMAEEPQVEQRITEEATAGRTHGSGDPGGAGDLPVPMVSSDVSHLQYRGTGLRDFLRHARMVVDALRLNATRHVRW